MLLNNKLLRKFKHPDLLEILIQSLKIKNVEEKIKIAENSDTPSEILIQLSKNENWYVRRAVAGNPNTPVETLAQLSKDEEQDVRNVAICSLKRV